MNKFVKKKGFTLVEIMVVVVVISLVLYLGISSYGVARKKVKLDISTNTVESVLIEARDKARAGYYTDSDESLCFGVKATEDAFVEIFRTKFNRLEREFNQCSRNSADYEPLRIEETDETIVIKEIIQNNNSLSELEVFFKPPHADLDISASASDPKIRIVVGYQDSDDPLDKREVVLDTLTGNVYSKRYEE